MIFWKALSNWCWYEPWLQHDTIIISKTIAATMLLAWRYLYYCRDTLFQFAANYWWLQLMNLQGNLFCRTHEIALPGKEPCWEQICHRLANMKILKEEKPPWKYNITVHAKDCDVSHGINFNQAQSFLKTLWTFMQLIQMQKPINCVLHNQISFKWVPQISRGFQSTTKAKWNKWCIWCQYRKHFINFSVQNTAVQYYVRH